MNWTTRTQLKNISVQSVEKGKVIHYNSKFISVSIIVLCFHNTWGFELIRYNALDALRLVSFEDDDFHCESCNGKLEVESDKFVVQEGADGDDNARRRRHEKLKDMLQKMEVLL